MGMRITLSVLFVIASVGSAFADEDCDRAKDRIGQSFRDVQFGSCDYSSYAGALADSTALCGGIMGHPRVWADAATVIHFYPRTRAPTGKTSYVPFCGVRR